MGATIGRAGARRATPLATATLVVAANAPDVDMLSYARGPYFALSFRRGITHGLPALVVLPFAVTAVMLAWDRWVRRRRDPGAEPARAGTIFLLAVLGLATHPVLDWMNTYGMRWWLPFDGRWSYGDTLFIIDPWLWLGLGGALFLSTSRGRSARLGWGLLALFTSTLILAAPLPLTAAVRWVWAAGLALVVSAAVAGRPATDRGRRRVPTAVGAAAVAYIVALWAAGNHAGREVERAAVARGLTVRDVMVAPLPANPFTSEVEVLTGDGFVPGAYRWLRSPRVELHPERAVPLRSGPSGLSPSRREEIVAAARAAPDARRWLVWSRYPYVRVEEEGEGWRVRFHDARYDDRDGAGSLGGVSVALDRSLRLR